MVRQGIGFLPADTFRKYIKVAASSSWPLYNAPEVGFCIFNCSIGQAYTSADQVCISYHLTVVCNDEKNEACHIKFRAFALTDSMEIHDYRFPAGNVNKYFVRYLRMK